MKLLRWARVLTFCLLALTCRITQGEEYPSTLSNESPWLVRTAEPGELVTVVREGRLLTTMHRCRGGSGESGPLRGDGLVNGDFSDGLADWTVEESGGGDAPGQVYVDNEQAVILEGDSFLVTLQQTFVVPANALTLSFELVLDPGFDLSDDFIPDAFETTLLDQDNLPVVPPWDILATSFFNVQEDGTINLGSATVWDGLTAIVDISDVAFADTRVTLFFDLIGADADTASGVRLDNVVVACSGSDCYFDCNGNGVADECDLDCGEPGGPCDVPGCGTGADCNNNGFPDDCDIASDPDCNGNGILDECETDCQANGVPDDCDTDPTDPDGNGEVSEDCSGDGIPDECETDCQPNGVPDQCDIDHGTSLDCNGNGDPDECDPDCDGDVIPDDCEIADCLPDDPACQDCNGNDIPDECDIADSTSQDCNGSTVPDECELAGNDCDGNSVPDECQADCDADGTPDACMLPPFGTSSDCNVNEIPDECEVTAPSGANDPHDVRKNRYISFNPTSVACGGLRIDLTSMRRCSGQPSRACVDDNDCEAAVPGSGTCIQHADVGSAGPWWVQAPQQEPLGCIPGPCGDEDWFARVDSTPYFDTWTLATLHIGDCEIIPVATYEIRACAPPDGMVCSDPLTIGTIAQPFVSPGFRGNYGDVAGPVEGTAPDLYFTLPDGITNVIDVSAYILTKQNYGTANVPQTHPTWVDLHGLGDGNPPQPPPPNGNPPNYILNVSDLQQIVKAFVGDAWTDDPGNMNPGQCP